MDFLVSFTVEDRDWAEWIANQLDALGYGWSFDPPPPASPSSVSSDVSATTAVGAAALVVLSSALLAEFERTGPHPQGPLPDRGVGLVQVEPLSLPDLLAALPIASMQLAADDFAATRQRLVDLVTQLRPLRSAALPVAEAATGEADTATASSPADAEAATASGVAEAETAEASVASTLGLVERVPMMPEPPSLPVLEVEPIALVAAAPAPELVEQPEPATVEVGAGRSAGLFGTDWGARPWEDNPKPIGFTDNVIDDKAEAEALDRALDDLRHLDPLADDDREPGASDAARDAPPANAAPATSSSNGASTDPSAGALVTPRHEPEQPALEFAELTEHVSNVSQPRTPAFWNRTALLDHLAGTTSSTESAADAGASSSPAASSRGDDVLDRANLTLDLRDGRPQIVVTSLVGPRGVGKTALAREVVAELDGSYDVVWWVRAADRTTYLADLADLAERVVPGEGEPDRRLRTWLGATEARWLLVFDDVPSWDVVKAALPETGRGTVLVTAAAGVAMEGNIAEVHPFGADSATGFLLQRASRTDHDGAAELAAHLGGHAAALELAGAYVAAMSISFGDYLAELADTSAPHGLKLQAPGTPLEAATLAALRAISYYSTRAASAAVGLAATSTAGPLPVSVLDQLSEEAENPLGDLLASFGLIVADETHVAMPPAFRDAIRVLAPEGPEPGLIVEFADALERAHGDHVDPAGTTLLLAHAADLVTTGVRVGAVSPSMARLAVHAGAWATWAGDADRGTGLVRSGLDLSEHQHGPDHPDTEAARRTLAELTPSEAPAGRLIGQPDEAPLLSPSEEIRKLTEDLADIEATQGADSIDALAARNVLASAYADSGDFSTAEQLLAEIFDRCVATLGSEHIDSLTARANLANSYADRGEFARAVELQEAVSADHERVLGNDHPYTLTARNNLANTYASLGRHDEALRLQQHVVADYERTQGPDHLNSLTAKHNLANSYADLGRHDEALQLREQVLEQRNRVLGSDHPQTLGARNNLANSYADLGRHDEALQLRQQVLEQRERQLGGDHPHTLTARNNLANSFAALGRHGEALILRERALTDCDRILGPYHPHTLTARNNLANTYSALGDEERAQRLRSEVLASRGLSSRAAAAVAGVPVPTPSDTSALELLPESLQPATDTPSPGRRKRRFWFFGR